MLMALVKTVELRILASAGDAQAKLDEVAKKADEMNAKGVHMRFRVDDAAGKAQLDALKARADKLGFKDVSLKVKVDGAGRAIADLEAVRAEAGRLGGLKRETVGGGGGALLPSLLLGLPAIATLTGVTAGAAIGLGGAFVAAGGAVAAFGAVAKPVLSAALKAEQAVNTAQNTYQAALATGLNPAKAYRAEQLAISKAYADLSPQQIALSRQLGNMAQAWQDLKAKQTPVVAGALQPWLKSVTDLTGKLGPVIAAVSPVIKDLGARLDGLVGSSAFRGFRDFIAGTGTAVVSATGGTLINFLKGFMILLPQFDPLIREAAAGITRIGTAFANWAGSSKAASEIQGFLRWFSQNGPVVGGLLKNIGGTLKTLLPGLTAGGMGELSVISGFFGLIAKLPPGLARPIAEVAGALLLLNKLGVIKVGLQLLGLGAAEGAGAAGLWGKLLPGVRLAGGALVATIIVSSVLKGIPSGPGGKNWWDNPFGADPKARAPAAQGLSTWAGLGHVIVRNLDEARHSFAVLGHDAASAFDTARHAAATAGHDIAHAFDTARHSVASAFDHVRHDIASKFDGVRHDIASKFDGAVGWLKGAAHDTASAFDNVRHDIAAKFDNVRHDIAAKFSGAIGWLVQAGKNIIGSLISGIESAVPGLHSVLSWIGSLIPKWKGPPEADRMLLFPAGQAIMAGLMHGMDSQMPAFRAQLAGVSATAAAGVHGGYGGGGTHVYNINIHSLQTSDEIAATVVKAIKQYKRHGGNVPLGLG